MTGEQEERSRRKGEGNSEREKNELVLQLQTETQKIHDQAEVLLAAVTEEPGMSLWHLA